MILESLDEEKACYEFHSQLEIEKLPRLLPVTKSRFQLTGDFLSHIVSKWGKI